MGNIGFVVRRALTGLAPLLAVLPATTTTTTSASAQASKDGTCGFYFTNPDHDRASARYYHCGNSFILIQVDWNTGWRERRCVPPWYSMPFYSDGPNHVVNAYYIPVAPDLIEDSEHRICRTAQPQG